MNDSPDAMQPVESVRLEWMTRLLGMTSPAEIARAIVAMVRMDSGCEASLILWSGADQQVFATPGAGIVDADQAQSARALLVGTERFAIVRKQLAIALQQAHAVLLLQVVDPGAPPVGVLESIDPYLQLAEIHLQRALNLVDLRLSHKQLARSENLQRALFAISDLAGSDRDMPEMLRGIHQIVSTLMYAENFFIVRQDVEQGNLRFLYFVDVEDLEVPDPSLDFPLQTFEHTLTWHVLVSGKALMGTGEQLERQVEGGLVTLGPDSLEWLGVPMLRDGQVFGALVVQSYHEGIGFGDEDRAILEFVGSHILTALERKQSKDELEQQVRLRTLELAEANLGLRAEVLERQRAELLQAALFNIAQQATADIDEDEFYQRLHGVVGKLINAENFFIALLSEDRRMLAFPYYVDAGKREERSREIGRGLSEYVLRLGEPVIGGQARIDQLGRAGEIDPQRIGRPAVCWLGVPLRVNDQVIGLVAVQSYASSVIYGQADQELLSFVALQIANSIHRRRAAVSLHRAYEDLEHRVAERTLELREQILQREQIQEQLKHQVMHDSLTGLPNRSYLRECLERTLPTLRDEADLRCALLYLDVDRFKVVNDSLGHLAGDEILREVARRLRKCVPASDVVARLSGDEFAILLEDARDVDAVKDTAQRVLDVISRPLVVSGREIEPSVSIGIAIGDARYSKPDELLRDADLALYRAKQLGRKRYAFFEDTLARHAVDVLTLESQLRQALQRDEFLPYFQPIFRLADAQAIGHEALLRWNHPLEGPVAPDAFVKVAQESGQIEAIDWRLFELACRQMAQVQHGERFVTINVSTLHLRHGDFDRRLLRLLDHTRLSPSRLIIEVTESVLLENPERVRATLERLRRAGVGAALDDFGTGYSSLSHLHSLPLRMLKIDRSFVHALDAQERVTTRPVVAAILAMASALEIQVVAEGIETTEQRDALVAMGCEFGQGYLLGRPAAMAVTSPCNVALSIPS